MSEPLEFTVDGIGRFTASRRTLGTQIAIERRYAKELGGPEDGAPESLRSLAAIKAQLDTLLVEMPPAFQIDAALLDDIYQVFTALRSAEDRFLGELAAQRQAAGAGAR